jgi:hypothetical protein
VELSGIEPLTSSLQNAEAYLQESHQRSMTARQTFSALEVFNQCIKLAVTDVLLIVTR